MGLAEFLSGAQAQAAHEPLAITVRDLLAQWQAKRRGYKVVDRIRADLDKHGLATDPDFNGVWIDAFTWLVPALSDGTEESTTKTEALGTPPAPREVYLRVSNLESANSGLFSVSPQDSIQKAQSLMMRYDFSQLPVLSGDRDLRGAVSWESIAQARIRSSTCTLTDAMGSADLVLHDDDLIAQIPRIVSAGFVFVQAKDRRIVGIVTTADLSQAFARLAKPFFMVGEIERQVRNIIDRHFERDELRAIVDPGDVQRSVDNADDLTFGEYKRLLENPDNWTRLGWDLDRQVFVAALDDVREIRNEVMHFSPDPVAESDIEKLTNFAQWLRKIRPR